MDLKQSLELAKLREGKSTLKTHKITAAAVTKRVFQLAAQSGRPMGLSAKAWQKKWLASEEFVLTEIETAQAALPSNPSSLDVQKDINASVDSLAPIVVDVNKNGVGRAFGGYVPKLIVVDGGSRQRAASYQGRDKIQAWVGVKAIKSLLANAQISSVGKLSCKACKPTATKIEAAAILSRPVPRQDKAEPGTGTAPHTPMPTVIRTRDQLGNNTTKVVAGARPVHEAAQKPGSPWIDPRDAEAPKVRTPGHLDSKPMLRPDHGASKSELAEVLHAATGKRYKLDAAFVKEMWQKFKAACSKGYKHDMSGKAAPGWEESVKKMKDHPEIDNPWALSHWMDQEGYTPGGSGKK